MKKQESNLQREIIRSTKTQGIKKRSYEYAEYDERGHVAHRSEGFVSVPDHDKRRKANKKYASLTSFDPFSLLSVTINAVTGQLSLKNKKHARTMYELIRLEEAAKFTALLRLVGFPVLLASDPQSQVNASSTPTQYKEGSNKLDISLSDSQVGRGMSGFDMLVRDYQERFAVKKKKGKTSWLLSLAAHRRTRGKKRRRKA